jgi:tetratricopeptide (TPR) repeat protein
MGQPQFRNLLILAGLFLISLSIRFYYLLELSQIPFFDTVLKSFDHHNFDMGAQSVAQGDWLARSPNNSYSPLYKYFLGAIYAVFGRNFYAIYGIQFVLGALGSVLIFLAGKKLFDARVGFIAFLGFSFYSTEIIYEGVILRAAFITFLGILSFYLLIRLQDFSTTSRLVVLALVLSLFFQSRPNTLLCLPFIIVFLHKYVFKSWDREERLNGWVIFLMPFCLSFVPILMQCYFVHGKFVFLDASGPRAFLAGNFIDYPGFGFVPNLLLQFQKENGLENLSPASFVFQQITNDPLGFIGLYLRKIYFFFNDLEATSNISPLLYQESSKVLPYSLNHFSYFSSLGLMGIVLAIRKREKLFLLYSYLFAMTLSVILFHVVARFRIPAAPFLILFSAYAIGRAMDWMKGKQFKKLGLFGMIFISFLYGFRAPDNSSAVRYVDYCNWGYAHMLNKKWFDLEKAEKYGLDCYESQGLVQSGHRPGFVVLTTLYKLYGYYLMSEGSERAEAVLRKAISIDPFSSESYRMLAEMEEKRGNVSSAVRNLHLSVLADRSDPDSLKELIRIYYQSKSDPGRMLAALKTILPIEKDLKKIAMVKSQISKLGDIVDEKNRFMTLSMKRAEKLFLEEQWKSALKEYENINAFNHLNASNFFKQGAVYERLGKKEKALDLYYDSLLIDPLNSGLNEKLGNYYSSIGENALAVLHWTRYLDVAKNTENSLLIQSRMNKLFAQLFQKNLIKQVPNLSIKENQELYYIFNGPQ